MLPRSSWTDLPKVGYELTGPLPLVVIHHSYKPGLPADATEAEEIDALRSMDRYHRENNEWAGLAYSFCVFQSGRIYEGRGWLRSGAHTEGQNSKSHGICWVIDGNKHTPTPTSVQAVKDLITDGIRIGAVKPDYRVDPHDKYKNKPCPGSFVKAIFPKLLPGSPGEHVKDVLPLLQRTLRLGDRGEDVRAVQKRLAVKPESGFYGKITAAAVRNFQKKNGLVVDGAVGPLTRAKLGL